MTIKHERGSTAMNVLAIVGFLGIIIIGIWGAVNAIRLAPQMFSGVASFFSRVDDSIEITLPSTDVQSETPFTIGWKHSGGKNGHYAFSYRCREDFVFQMTQSDGAYKPIVCESPVKIPTQDEQTLRLIPVSGEARFLDVPFVIAYIDNEGEILAEGNHIVTVGNPDTSESDTNNTTNRSDNNTDAGVPKQADLAVRILETGIIDPASLAFIPRHVISQGDTGAVRFEVKNIGTAASGTWAFTANLPTSPTFQYNSKRQQSLSPQDRIEYTIRFDRLQTGSATFFLHADPTNEVRESSESNNTISSAIVVQ